jgi:hypothetical protein
MSSPAAVRAYLVDTALGGASGLYLHAPQVAVPAQDEVEAFAVSVGLGDPKAQTGRFVCECQLDEFAFAFRLSEDWLAIPGPGW